MTQITMAECRQIVGEYYLIPKDIMLSPSKMRKIARPRQMAMTLAREFTNNSLPAIARHFHRGDHTTVLHAQRAVYELEEYSFFIAQNMENFRLALLTYKAQQEVTLMDSAR